MAFLPESIDGFQKSKSQIKRKEGQDKEMSYQTAFPGYCTLDDSLQIAQTFVAASVLKIRSSIAHPFSPAG